MLRKDYWVTVCDSCRRASCWHGVEYCEQYETAGTVDVLASDLRKESNEHPSYFSRKEIVRVCGGVKELANGN